MAGAVLTVESLRMEDARRTTSPRRWAIVALLLAAAILNYVDRTVLAILAPTIQSKLAISNTRYAHINDGFLIAYAFAYLVSGRLVEKLGTRLSMAIFIGFWSMANALNAFAKSATSLTIFRSLLGLGEAGAWTAAPAAVAEWFSAKERALATGIYSVGGTIGATVAPLLVVATASRFGWQSAFVVTGLFGFVIIIPWLVAYRTENDRAGTIERDAVGPIANGVSAANVEAHLALAAHAPQSERALWAEVVRQPMAWRLMAARLMTDSVWYFFLFWLPKYFHDARGLTQAQLGILWVVFLAADIGFVAGGFFSDRLVAAGFSPPLGRRRILQICATLTPVLFFVPFASTLWLTLAAVMIVAFSHCMWLSNITALVIDVIPRRIMPTTFGFIAAGSALGGIMMNNLVAWAVGHYSYSGCFYVMATLHPLAVLLFLRKKGLIASESTPS